MTPIQRSIVALWLKKKLLVEGIERITAVVTAEVNRLNFNRVQSYTREDRSIKKLINFLMLVTAEVRLLELNKIRESTSTAKELKNIDNEIKDLKDFFANERKGYRLRQRSGDEAITLDIVSQENVIVLQQRDEKIFACWAEDNQLSEINLTDLPSQVLPPTQLDRLAAGEEQWSKDEELIDAITAVTIYRHQKNLATIRPPYSMESVEPRIKAVNENESKTPDDTAKEIKKIIAEANEKIINSVDFYLEQGQKEAVNQLAGLLPERLVRIIINESIDSFVRSGVEESVIPEQSKNVGVHVLREEILPTGHTPIFNVVRIGISKKVEIPELQLAKGGGLLEDEKHDTKSETKGDAKENPTDVRRNVEIKYYELNQWVHSAAEKYLGIKDSCEERDIEMRGDVVRMIERAIAPAGSNPHWLITNYVGNGNKQGKDMMIGFADPAADSIMFSNNYKSAYDVTDTTTRISSFTLERNFLGNRLHGKEDMDAIKNQLGVNSDTPIQGISGVIRAYNKKTAAAEVAALKEMGIFAYVETFIPPYLFATGKKEKYAYIHFWALIVDENGIKTFINLLAKHERDTVDTLIPDIHVLCANISKVENYDSQKMVVLLQEQHEAAEKINKQQFGSMYDTGTDDETDDAKHQQPISRVATPSPSESQSESKTISGSHLGSSMSAVTRVRSHSAPTSANPSEQHDESKTAAHHHRSHSLGKK